MLECKEGFATISFKEQMMQVIKRASEELRDLDYKLEISNDLL